jgi:hypothetical protein
VSPLKRCVALHRVSGTGPLGSLELELLGELSVGRSAQVARIAPALVAGPANGEPLGALRKPLRGAGEEGLEGLLGGLLDVAELDPLALLVDLLEEDDEELLLRVRVRHQCVLGLDGVTYGFASVPVAVREVEDELRPLLALVLRADDELLRVEQLSTPLLRGYGLG